MSAAVVVEALALELQATDVEPGRRDADLLGEREEGEHERDHDRPEDQAQPIRLPSGAERSPNTAAGEDRALGDAPGARQPERARTGALVDGHRQSPSAKRIRGLRGSRKPSGSA